LFFADRFLVQKISPRDLTYGNIYSTKRRIINFAKKNNRLPLTLAELPAMPSQYHTNMNDAWNYPLKYSFDSSGIISVQSLGADNLPGGEGDNRDMIGIFESHDVSGKWQDEFVRWTHDPIKP
jgi:hypothetical protein